MTVQVYDGDGRLPETNGVRAAVDWLLTQGEAAAALKQTDRDELIIMHHSLGRWIRNTLKLWADPPPEPLFTDALHYFTTEELKREGMFMGDKLHPDNVSQLIIEQAWKRLRG